MMTTMLPPDDSAVEMEVRALVMDPVSKMPVVILHDRGENRYLPIWIGVCEANAIALELEGVKTPRPMTHDLIGAILATVGFRVERIVVHNLADNVFLAAIHLLDDEGRAYEVDSRPSDAIAVALRAKAGIFVSPSVLKQAVVEEADQEEAVKMILERLRPEDLGEYEM